MKWELATNKQIKSIVEADGECFPHLLKQAVEEAIKRDLYKKYMYTIIAKRLSKKYVEQVLKTTYEDIIQVFRIKAFDAVKWFKPGKRPFLGFWTRFMLRALRDIVRDSKSKKRTGETVSIEDELTHIQLISDKNVERLVVNRLTINELFSCLTPFERSIVICREQGYTFPEISKMLGYHKSYMHKTYKQALVKMRRVEG